MKNFLNSFNLIEIYDEKFNLHSLTEPAIVNEHETIWFKHGTMHRDDDEPAYVNTLLNISLWCKDGLLHRDNDKPAYVYNGKHAPHTSIWCVEGSTHRVNGPAVIVDGVIELWYNDGVLHNSNGPCLLFYEKDTITFDFKVTTNRFGTFSITTDRAYDTTDEIIDFIENNGYSVDEILNEDCLELVRVCGLLRSKPA